MSRKPKTLALVALGGLAALLIVACGTDSGAAGSGGDALAGAADAAAGSDAIADSGSPATTDGGGSVADVTAVKDTFDAGPPVCSPSKNTGCGAGEKCDYDENDVPRCVKAGSLKSGEPCQGPGECAVGTCITSQNGSTQCAPYCVTVSGLSSCPGEVDCNKVDGHKWKVCDMAKYTPCDPFKQDCDDKTQACYSGQGGFNCLKAGTAEIDASCQSTNDCKKGLTCAGNAGASGGFCKSLCDPTKPAGQNGCTSMSAQCSKISGSVGYCDG